MRITISIICFMFILTYTSYYAQSSNDDVSLAYIYINHGNKYFNQNKLIKAVYCYKEAVKINPKLAGAYVNLAVVYYKIGDYTAFLSNIKKAAMLGDRQSSKVLSVLKP